jgi:hypothetical protein
MPMSTWNRSLRVSSGHDYLFQRSVARPLADAVDASLNLPGAGFDGGQAVGDRQAQVVVAVDAQGHSVHAGNLFLDVFQQLGKVGRDGVPHRVGDVDGGGAGPNYCFQHRKQVFRVGAGGVHRGELHIAAIALGPLHHGDGHLHDLFPVLAELVHHMDVGR